MHLFIRLDVIVGSQRERYANVRKGSHDLYLRTVEFVNVNWQGPVLTHRWYTILIRGCTTAAALQASQHLLPPAKVREKEEGKLACSLPTAHHGTCKCRLFNQEL